MSIFTLIRSSISAFAIGNFLVLRFFFFYTFALFQLPPELYDDNALKKRLGERKSFDVAVERKIVDNFDDDIERLKCQLRNLWQGPTVDYKTKQTMFWVVRIATVLSAFSGSLKLTFFMSILQFVVLPYSLSVAIGYGCETILWGYLHHILVYPVLTALIQRLIPDEYQLMITITPSFLVWFLVVDQLLCTLCLFWTPAGKPKPIPKSRIWESISYGFFNCKTYFLILLPLCFGINIPVIPWILDAMFGISSVVSTVTMRYIQILFYPIHRLGHLPHVYSDSHRFHHHLHDATAFDAHILGSGVTEEWLLLVLDVVLAFSFGTPGCFNPHLLNLSWADKYYFHTRIETGHVLDEVNFHVDHHMHPNKNFGTSYPFELLMGTAAKEDGKTVIHQGFKVELAKDHKTIRMTFTPLDD